jgi:cell division protein FtsI/penicillin-binding protein 2
MKEGETMVKRRSIFLRASVAFVLVGLSGRLAWVQLVKADEITKRSDEQRLGRIVQEPIRGPIVDRNGKPLAISVGQYTVVANPLQMQAKDMDVVASTLAEPLGMKAETILAMLKSNPKSQYVPLKKSLDWNTGLKIKQMMLLGINLQQQQQRIYPQGFTANHILGYLSADGQGQYGLEGFYDKELSGQPGFVVSEFTNEDTPITDTIKQEVPPVQGKKLVLTIDAGLQQFVESKLDETVKTTKARRALAIAMDVHTGEILTLAIRPGASPSDRSTWGNPVDYNRLTNWALTTVPVGSIFKTLTTSGALEEGAITTSTLINDPGFLKVGSDTIRNWDLMVPPKSVMSIAELLQRSSNVGLIQVGQRLGPERFLKYLSAFGLMEKTGIEQMNESGAYGLDHFADKKPIDWANMYIGQHAEYTPIEIIRAIGSIANNGLLVQPHLVKEMQDADGKVIWTPPVAAKRQAITETTAKEVQTLMISVVEKAYQAAKPAGYTVGGKTGTAEQYPNGKLSDFMMADFIGFSPAVNPQIIMLVMVDGPPPPGYGGVYAVPLFAKLLPAVMQAKGIPPNSDAAMGTETAPPKVVLGTVPNVQWLPVADAQQRLTAAGFTASLKGNGNLVSTQSLKPGSPARAGTDIELDLTAADDKQAHVPDFTGLSLTEADQLASNVGLSLKANGSGFVASQDPPFGASVPRGTSFYIRLAPASATP